MEHSEIRRKAFSGVFWKFMERFIAQGISLIVSIIIARILTPTEYSVIGIITVFFNFANIFITSGLNTALIQKKDADEIDYSTVLYTSVCLSFIAYIALFFSAPYIAQVYHLPILIIMIRVMGISLPITAIKSVWCSYISSNLLFKKFFYATLGGTIVSGIVGIYMAMHGFGAWSLIVQQMSNTIIDTLILVLCTKVKVVLNFSFLRLKQLFGYSWKIFLSSLIGTAYTEISPLVIGIKFTPNDLSFYTKGKSFPSMLSTTATNTLSAVLFPVLAKYQDDKKKILDYTRLYMRLSSFVSFPIMLGFFAVAENFIHVVLTDKWLPAVYYIQVFCVCYMFDVVAIGNCETIKAIGRSDIYLIIEIIKKIGYFATLFIFIFLSKSAHILALAYIVCTVIQVAVNTYPNVKLIGYRYIDQLKDLLPNLILALVMCLVTTIIGNVMPLGLLTLLVQIVVGILTFITLCYLSKNKAFNYFVGLLRNHVNKRSLFTNE